MPSAIRLHSRFETIPLAHCGDAAKIIPRLGHDNATYGIFDPDRLSARLA
jgi:hypothetical protein